MSLRPGIASRRCRDLENTLYFGPAVHHMLERINVVRPAALELAASRLEVHAGATAELKGKVVREGTFKELVTVSIKGLPVGLKADPVTRARTAPIGVSSNHKSRDRTQSRVLKRTESSPPVGEVAPRRGSTLSSACYREDASIDRPG